MRIQPQGHHGVGQPTASIDTTKGMMKCALFPDKAPLGVENFIGLATGSRDWRNPTNGLAEHGVPLYDGTIFHRVIPNFMIQGGDPAGTGTGDPGYKFKNEVSSDLLFDKPGRLAYANAGPDTNGSQFFITEVATPHLNGYYTIFGQCDEATVALVREIARTAVDPSNDRPIRPVRVIHVRIAYGSTTTPGAPPTRADNSTRAVLHAAPAAHAVAPSAPSDSVGVPTSAVPTPQLAVLEIYTTPLAVVAVYVDDQPRGATESDGHMRVPGLPPGQHRLRLEGPKYERFEETVDLVAGLTTTSVVLVPVALSGRSATIPLLSQPGAASVGADEKENGTTFEVWHFHSSRHWENPQGQLKLSNGSLDFHEDGPYARTEDDFRVRCSEVKGVKQTSDNEVHIKLQSKTYRFWVFHGEVHAGYPKEKSAAIVSAIREVCGRR